MRLPSLRARIFIALIFLVMVASLLIAGVTIVQYSEPSNTYHEQSLERKEKQLKKQLKYLIESTPLGVEAATVSYTQQQLAANNNRQICRKTVTEKNLPIL